MSQINEMLKFNKQFVENKEYVKYITSGNIPEKKIAILSCMDTRLTELLPAALNFKNGDIKIIKNAGAIITHPFGSVMRSLIVGIYKLEVEEIIVIGHSSCGMQNLDPSSVKAAMIDSGIAIETINTVDYSVDIDKWLGGFNEVNDSVLDTVNMIRNHPLIHDKIIVSGCVMNPDTGETTLIC